MNQNNDMTGGRGWVVVRRATGDVLVWVHDGTARGHQIATDRAAGIGTAGELQIEEACRLWGDPSAMQRWSAGVHVIPTFASVIAMEPLIGALLDEIRAIRAEPGFCANHPWWYERFKPRLKTLVGWEGRHATEWMRDTLAWDIAYHALYDALPDCDHEPRLGCMVL